MILTDSVKSIKGVGDKTMESFVRLGINTVQDLLTYYPRTYVTYEDPVCIKELSPGTRQSVRAVINSRAEVRKIHGLSVVILYARDYSGTIKLTWFNCPFLRYFFHIGQEFVFVGEVAIKNGMLTMTQPEYYTPEKYGELTHVWQPVYTVTAGITSKTIQKAVKAAMPVIDSIPEYLPDDALKEYDILGISDAVRTVHFPLDEQHLKKAIKRIAFDEFFRFICGLHSIKEDSVYLENRCKISCDRDVYEFINGLSFTLTGAQMEAVRDVLSDMNSEHVMNRLIQGDVGSGKTIVAAVSLFAASKCGYQGVLMAPTEVLAVQHYNELKERFEPYNIRVGLLTGSMTAKDKRAMYQLIKEGEISVVIGTHALIQDKVEYNNLGLVVTDEQHRFGVRQRQKLSEKGEMPHTLVMSATPIPRTLAIIMYGDLDISVIDELPKGRIPIKNCVVDDSFRKTARGFIVREVSKGHQVYIVCPMVEASEALDSVSNVIEYTEELKEAIKKEYGAQISVTCLHGRMKAAEKNKILDDFYKGEISILVSTTVIEVGINNPNATVMMVENAERFGLAQLHQLRGRVGRGNLQSYCIFMSGKKDKATMERLSVLEKSNDGFFIAGEDLKMRGPGDFFGVRQSGDIMFKVGDIYNHADMLKAAQSVYAKYKDICENASYSVNGDMAYFSPVL
ncbi:MAG: ATP-dependent DNA helicase RecG [Coprococcus sp.]|nr:ATP-dependent DNA helicase RecG [Coprococcus sp.]